MQVNKPFKIQLIFKGPNKSYTITEYLFPSVLLYGVKNYGKPIAFKWLELNTKPDSPKLIKWIEEEFKPLFEDDPFMWFASVGTCPVELRPYLIPFHKES